MGALHAGHASLVKRSVSENGVTVVSVFVNPTQFNDKNDLEKYPRTLDADCRLLEECGADFAFVPSVDVYKRQGMDHADCIMCVSELTRRTVINEYHQDPRKVFAMHNAVYPLSQELLDIPRPDHSKEKVVTFLGRITMQKGPEYFVEAAALVLRRTRNIRFVMAGSGDMLNAMINLVAERGIADRFHFPGFMKGKQVYEVYKNSDVFVMPSVSEPFGIAPLEAMQCGTPSIISKQSGCGELLDKVIKTDYWDIHAMADAIHSLCTNPSLFEYLKEEGKKEVDGITWEKVGLRIRALYDACLLYTSSSPGLLFLQPLPVQIWLTLPGYPK